jgi:23S rRNA (cytosine1962-C5)-methyltransferase
MILATLPRIILKPRRALPFFARHPWLFVGAIARVEGDPDPGAEVAVVSHEGQFIARGLFNPASNIRVRLYSWNAEAALDEDLWSRRLDAAIALRRDLFRDMGPETACRLVFSEADGLSGLTVDRYGEWLLVQLTSRALAARRDVLFRLLTEKLAPAGIWLRTEKGIGEAEGLEIADGLVSGREPPRPLFISEHGIRYGIDVIEGQKTGFYLDQRDNRAAFARSLRPDARVLDVFCYSGGFGLAAVVLGGARHVVGIDVSEAALALARANAQLNGVADRFRFEPGRAFDVLERLAAAGERFDAVVLDPPKLTRHKAGVPKALKAYHQLNRQAVAVLRPGGLLVTCSCSGLVTRDEFKRMLAEVALRTDRPLQILEFRGAAADHPMSVHCPETAYLKCCVCRVA